MLLADVYGRFSRLRNAGAHPPLVMTGTDEHGLKIQRVAEGKGLTPQELCDGVSPRFKVSSPGPTSSHRFLKPPYAAGSGGSC